MEVKSKFNIGDAVYFMYGAKPKVGVITGITFQRGSRLSTSIKEPPGFKKDSTTYHLNDSIDIIDIDETYVHGSIEELKDATFRL